MGESMDEDIEEQKDTKKLSQLENILCGWLLLLGVVKGAH
jgi:hypothetical protein